MKESVKEKTSDIHVIVVECKFENYTDTKEFNVDAEIFDDVLLEAATRFAEQHIQLKITKISPILNAYEKKDAKNYNKHFCYNTYYIMINAGFYSTAEIIRKNFLQAGKIDLQKESLRGQYERPDSTTN